jgi:MFS family permease
LVLATGLEVCVAAFSPWEAMLYIGLALAGLLSIWFIALANALVQLRSDPGLRGRVMGVWTMALPGMLPVTSLLVGAVATVGGGALGARLAFALSGLALTAAALVGWRALADNEDDEYLEALLASSAAPLATAAA